MIFTNNFCFSDIMYTLFCLLFDLERDFSVCNFFLITHQFF